MVEPMSFCFCCLISFPGRRGGGRVVIVARLCCRKSSYGHELEAGLYHLTTAMENSLCQPSSKWVPSSN